MKKKIRAIQYGIGPIGASIAKLSGPLPELMAAVARRIGLRSRGHLVAGEHFDLHF